MDQQYETPELTDEELKDIAEHENVLLDVRAILVTDPGKRFFKYLFKCFGVGHFPEQGLKDEMLHETLGYFRSGRTIFNLASQASPEVAAQLLSQNEKERYAAFKLLQEQTNGKSD